MTRTVKYISNTNLRQSVFKENDTWSDNDRYNNRKTMKKKAAHDHLGMLCFWRDTLNFTFGSTHPEFLEGKGGNAVLQC